MLQVYKRMFQGMFTATFGEGAGGQDMINQVKTIAQPDLWNFVRNNLPAIKEYFTTLDKNGNGIDASDMSSAQQRFDTNKLLEQLGMSGIDANSQAMRLQDILEAVDNLESGRTTVQNTSRWAQAATATELSGDNHPYAGAKVEIFPDRVWVSQIDQTAHVTTETNLPSTGWYYEQATAFHWWEVSMEEIRSTTNVASLENFLRSTSPTELSRLAAKIFADGMKNSDARKVIDEETNYDFDSSSFRLFGEDKEVVTLLKVISFYDVLNNDKNLSLSEKQELLLDIDRDGWVSNQRVDRTWEAQMRELIKSNPNGFSNLLANLGLTGLDLGNFFTAREKLQSGISNAVASGIKPAALVQRDGVANFVDVQLDMQQKSAVAIGEEVENLLLSDDRLSYLPAADRRRAIDAVKLEAIGMVLGDRSVLGASFDVRGITRDLIHNASVWMMQDSDGGLVPGIALSRTVLETQLAGRNIRVDAGAGAALAGSIKFVPFVNIAGEIIKPTVEVEWLFDQDIKGKIAVSGFVNISAKLSAGLVASKSSEKTTTGITEMVSQMDTRLGQVLLDVKSEQGFDTATYEWKTSADRDMYTQIKGLYERGATHLTESEKIVYLASMKNGYIENYASELYQNAEGYKITWVGLSYLAGCFPVPSIHGERINHKWVENNDDVGTSAEYVISRRESSLSAIGGIESSYEGKKTLYIQNITEVFGDESIQVVRDENGVHLSGDLRGKCLKLNTHEGTTGRNRVLHITNKTATSSTELVFEGRPTEGITSDVMIDASSISTRTDYKHVLDGEGKAAGTWIQTQAPQEWVRGWFVHEGYIGLAESVPENYKSAVKAIDSIVNVAWIGKETKTLMAEFQEMVYAKQNVDGETAMSDTNVNDAWEFFINNMLWDGKPGRSPSSWGATKLPDALKAAWVLDTVSSASTREEKMIIIEAVMNALRNDNSTKWGSIIKGQSLRGFSTTSTERSPNPRAEVFSGVLANKLGIRKELISQAQQDYYNTQIVVNGQWVTVWDQNSFDTAYVYTPAATMTAASQLNKNGIRWAIKLNSVQEYVVDQNGSIIETSVNWLSYEERNHRIKEMDNDDVSKRAQAVWSYLGLAVSADMVRDALLNNNGIIQSADGTRQVVLSYSMSFALTWNCFNDHIIERIGMEKQSMSAGQGRIEEKGYYVQEGNGLLVQETTTSGTNAPVYGSTAAVLWVNLDGGGNDNDRGTTPGEGDDRRTTPGEGWSANGWDVSTGNPRGPLWHPVEVTTPWPITQGAPEASTSESSIQTGLGFGTGTIRANRNEQK